MVIEENLAMNLEGMETRLKELEKKVVILDDIDKIKLLQRAYSYYVMRMMNQDIVDCFADHPDVALHWIEGSYLGKAGVKRYFGVGTDRPDPKPEFFHQVMPIAGVVDIEPGGDRAKGRWYTFGSHSLPQPDGTFKKSFVGGLLENEYIKENGIWKFLVIKWMIPYAVVIPGENWTSPENIGANIANPPSTGSLAFPAPDLPPNPNDPRFISGYVLPFHFRHPVTGQEAADKAQNLRVIATKKAQKKSP
jgi:hypothetical protein